MNNLPYVFDLLYDVKTTEQLIVLYSRTKQQMESLDEMLELFPDIKAKVHFALQEARGE